MRLRSAVSTSMLGHCRRQRGGSKGGDQVTVSMAASRATPRWRRRTGRVRGARIMIGCWIAGLTQSMVTRPGRRFRRQGQFDAAAVRNQQLCAAVGVAGWTACPCRCRVAGLRVAPGVVAVVQAPLVQGQQHGFAAALVVRRLRPHCAPGSRPRATGRACAAAATASAATGRVRRPGGGPGHDHGAIVHGGTALAGHAQHLAIPVDDLGVLQRHQGFEVGIPLGDHGLQHDLLLVAPRMVSCERTMLSVRATRASRAMTAMATISSTRVKPCAREKGRKRSDGPRWSIPAAPDARP